jgi:hypothetical protein
MANPNAHDNLGILGRAYDKYIIPGRMRSLQKQIENSANNSKTASSNMASLNLRELKQITDAIFDHIINDLKIEQVTIADDLDFYWEVPSEKLHAVKQPQPKLDVGRLADDWEFLEPLLKDKEQAVALMLTHVAPLLRRIGEDVGQ